MVFRANRKVGIQIVLEDHVNLVLVDGKEDSLILRLEDNLKDLFGIGKIVRVVFENKVDYLYLLSVERSLKKAKTNGEV